jgi:hypothetical protein
LIEKNSDHFICRTILQQKKYASKPYVYLLTDTVHEKKSKKCCQFPTFTPVFKPSVVLFFFRNIQFTSAIGLALYVGLLHFAAISGHLTPLPPMADAGFLYERIFGWTKDQPIWSSYMATVLVFIQAVLVNSLVDSMRLMNDRNWLPGMCYALMASVLPDFQFLSGPLVAITCLIPALRTVFQTYKSPKSSILVFDTAFWISVGSLFYPKALLLTIAVYFGISVMRSWTIKDRIAFILGIFVPIFLGWLWYFWEDSGGVFRQRHLSEIFRLGSFDAFINTKFILSCLFWVLLLLFFVLNYASFFCNKSMQGQKFVTVLYWTMFVGAAVLLFRSEWRWEAFLLAVTPASIFLAMALHNMRNLFAELLHATILGFVLLLQYAVL